MFRQVLSATLGGLCRLEPRFGTLLLVVTRPPQNAQDLACCDWVVPTRPTASLQAASTRVHLGAPPPSIPRTSAALASRSRPAHASPALLSRRVSLERLASRSFHLSARPHGHAACEQPLRTRVGRAHTVLEMPGGRPAGSRTGARKQTSAATAASAGRAKDKTIDLNGATLGSPNIDAPTTSLPRSPAPPAASNGFRVDCNRMRRAT